MKRSYDVAARILLFTSRYFDAFQSVFLMLHILIFFYVAIMYS